MPSEKRARQRAGRHTRMTELRRVQQRRRNYRRAGIAALIVVVFLLVAYFSTRGGGKKAASSTSTTAGATTTGVPTTVAGSSTTAGPPTTAGHTPPTAAPVPGISLVGQTLCPKANGGSGRVTHFSTTPPTCLAAGHTYTATFATNLGNVVVALNTTKTPITTNNFIVLALYHYYDGTAMFRTDTSIGIIQGGAPTTQSASDPGPGYSIKDEGSGYTYTAGDLVMARTSAPNSAGAQYFFCVTAACSALNQQGNYVVFGKVTSGLDVLQKILASNVNVNTGLGGAPSQLVTVKTLTIAES